MHKTGSTAIQRVLNGYSDRRARYADFNNQNHSCAIYPIFSKNPYNYRLFTSCGMSKEEVDKYIFFCKKKLEENLLIDDRIVIVSGEDISLLTSDELLYFNSYMKSYNRHVSVYSYLRNPFDFSSSYLSEIIKNGVSLDNIEKFYYGDIFEKFINIYGDDFYLRPYRRENGCVASDFFNWLDLNISFDSILEDNSALSENAIKLIFYLNRTVDTFINEMSLNARYLFVDYLSQKLPGKLNLTEDESEFFFEKGDINYVQCISGLEMGVEKFSNTPKPNFSVLQWAANLVVDDLNIMPLDIFNYVDIRYLPANKNQAFVVSLYWYFWIKANPQFLNFSAHKYIINNPDVAAANVNPYVHFITFGSLEYNRKYY